MEAGKVLPAISALTLAVACLVPADGHAANSDVSKQLSGKTAIVGGTLGTAGPKVLPDVTHTHQNADNVNNDTGDVGHDHDNVDQERPMAISGSSFQSFDT